MKPVLKIPPLLAKLAAFGVAASVSFALLAPQPAASPAASRNPVATAKAARARADFGKIPLSFEANGGQTDASVHFLSRGPGYALFLTDDEAVIRLGWIDTPKSSTLDVGTREPAPESVLRMKLVGAGKPEQVAGTEPQPGSANYFIGNDPKQWHSGVKTYGRVNYHGVYPGVDLVYYGNQRELEYDFIVAPGADASQIALAFDGAQPKVNAQGDLVLPVDGNEVRFHKPVVYQQVGEVRKTIEAGYVVAGNETRFQLGDYDHGQPLVIDPVLSYMTYLGGSSEDYIGNATSESTYGSQPQNGIAVDSQGAVYVVGSTVSTDFPVKNPYQASYPHPSVRYQAGFVTKINPTGTALVYSTYLGGESIDYGLAIAVDAAGSAYVTGETLSVQFPITANAPQKICAPYASAGPNGTTVTLPGCPGTSNAFVTKLSPDGSSLVYSTYLGGYGYGGGDDGRAIAVDAAGQAYVVGPSRDQCHPGGVRANYGNGNFIYQAPYECFPTTANAYVQGTENDIGSGNADYDGNTPANNPRHIQDEGFLSVFSADGSSLVYSTLLSHHPAAIDGTYGVGQEANAVAVDASGNVYIGGWANSTDLTTTPGAFQSTAGPVINSNNDQTPLRGFVAKFGAVGAGASGQPIYVTYLGTAPAADGSIGTYDNSLTGIAADAQGHAYALGLVGQPGFPVTAGAYQTVCGRDANDTLCSAAFVSKLSADGTSLVWSTLLGNQPSQDGGSVYNTTAVAVDASQNVYIVGTADYRLPQVNPVQTTTGGNNQAFITEFDSTGSKLLFSSLIGSGGTVGTQWSNGVALDTQGNIYLAGSTNTGASLPVTPGAAQPTFGGGGSDGFIAKVIRFSTTTTSLTINPSSVVSGTPATLTVTVAPPTGGSVPTGTVNFFMGTTSTGSATLDSTGSASTTVTLPSGSYSFTAVYAGDNSYSTSTSAPQTLTVTVPPPTPTVTISVSPTSVVLGSSATLSWSSTSATACTASGAWTGSEPTSGSLSVTPTAAGSSTYTLTCTGDGGSASNAAVLTVTAPPAPTVSITVSPGSVTLGQSATLTWSSTNATSCAASGAWSGAEAMSGSLSVTPTSTGTSSYTLTCTGGGGSTPATTNLTVNAAASTPPTVPKGGGAFGLWSLLPLLFAGVVRRRKR